MSYISSHKSQLIDSLENQILYADLACVVVGEKGIGKSFLLDKIRERVRSEVFVSEIQATPNLTPLQLEQSICLQLGLGWQDKSSSLLRKIESELARRVLLTIDDAHLLSLDCLQYLMENAARQLLSKKTNMFILLTGEANIASKLSETSILKENPNICALFELLPIDESETKYLVADFQAVDVGSVEALYESQKLNYFWQLSKGIPGDLAHHVERWVSQDENKAPTQSESAKPFTSYFVSLGYGTIAGLLILALIYQDEINRAINPSDKLQVTEEQKAPNSQVEQAEKEKISSSDGSRPSSKSTIKTERKLIKKDLQTEEKDKSKALELAVQSVSDNSETDNSTQLNEDKKKVLEVKQEEQISSKDNSSGENVPNQVKVPPPAQKKLELSDDELKLLAMNDSLFTLQWVGVSSLQAAKKYRDGHPLKNNMLIFKRQSGDGFLYLVVSGQFNAKIDAENSRTIYKKRGYAGKPWIKTIAAVKKEIKSSL
ncbi:MAG: AAA family ATPase [Kangiellaceae bacterium]|nr:AAA family ATPase [Kangiellaceae bacterium]MCW8997143.1 AAA family ATPase [Kangiellaceae bacterium]MCW9015612.1 AAA family ATPase [Kangiellaceae bacterium]